MADDQVENSTQVPDTPDTQLEALLGVKVDISAVLGTAIMPIAQILKLGRGAVVELNRSVDEDIEVHANNRLVAHGEVVVIDGKLGITLTKIIQLSPVETAAMGSDVELASGDTESAASENGLPAEQAEPMTDGIEVTTEEENPSNEEQS